MQAHYDVVVVGSGYGGAITACRAAQAGYDVCVLERGREMHPGDYPDRLLRAIRNTQARIRGRHVGDARALFDFHLDGDMNVLVGCGLGGTSLINANVTAEPDRPGLQEAAVAGRAPGTRSADRDTTSRRARC